MHDNDFHTGAKPQEELKGGMAEPNIQAPQNSESQTNPRSAAPDNIGQTWNSTSLKPVPAANPNNDRNMAH